MESVACSNGSDCISSIHCDFLLCVYGNADRDVVHYDSAVWFTDDGDFVCYQQTSREQGKKISVTSKDGINSCKTRSKTSKSLNH